MLLFLVVNSLNNNDDDNDDDDDDDDDEKAAVTSFQDRINFLAPPGARFIMQELGRKRQNMDRNCVQTQVHLVTTVSHMIREILSEYNKTKDEASFCFE